MELRKITKEKEDIKRAKTLYIEAFPRGERAPFSIMKRKIDSGCADFWNMFDGDKWIGWTYCITYEDMVYVFYFAIDKFERGKGYGTAGINALKEKYAGKRLFLALEDKDEENIPNREQRVKRHQFYINCGLTDLPYRLKEANMIYCIMGINGKVEPEEYKELIRNYIGGFYMKLFDMKIIK